MATNLRPTDEAEVEEAIRDALAAETPVEITAGASKRGLGRPMQADLQLDLSALRGILLYEADELVMSAGPATPVAEIEQLLAAQNQQLAFEPADYGPIYGAARGAGTIGGAFACNLAGPRRIKAGAARDHLLGLHGVSGRGEAFKSGGRVVKNVTGYDLCKLVTGSHGTLAAMTEVTFKVMPAPEKIRTALVFGLDDAAGIVVMAAAARSPHEVGGLAHLPAAVAAASAVGYIADAAVSVTALRVEGPGPSVEYRCAELRAMLAEHGAVEELHGRNSALFWREVRDAAAFAGAETVLWRLSVPPSAGATVVRRILEAVDGQAFYDWAGGLIWLALAPQPDGQGHDVAVRDAVGESGGHATLLRAPDAVRAAVPVFQPQPAPMAALTARIKDGFDPRRILNPGRMYPGV